MLTNVKLHPRLFIGAAIGIAAGFLMPGSWGELVRSVTAWDMAATVYLVLTWIMMARETLTQIRRRAALEDESGWTITMISAAAAAFSLCASIGLLSGYKDLSESLKPVYLSLGIYTILCSWFFLHTLFTLHYAHEYYGPTPEPDDGPTGRGGLAFPGDGPSPCYIEFAYFSFTIGMTAQTSDTAVTTGAMRGLTLAHAVLTFFFNTVILAFSINIAASLI